MSLYTTKCPACGRESQMDKDTYFYLRERRKILDIVDDAGRDRDVEDEEGMIDGFEYCEIHEPRR